MVDSVRFLPLTWDFLLNMTVDPDGTVIEFIISCSSNPILNLTLKEGGGGEFLRIHMHLSRILLIINKQKHTLYMLVDVGSSFTHSSRAVAFALQYSPTAF